MATKKPYVVHSDRTWLQAEKDLKALFKSWGVTDYAIRREGSACAVTWYPAGAARSVELTSDRRELLGSPTFRDMVTTFANTHRLALGTDKGFRGHALKVAEFEDWPLANVWEGVTVGNQRDAEAFIAPLLDTPASERFLSIEPLLGPIDLTCVDWSNVMQLAFEEMRDAFDEGDYRREACAEIAETINAGKHESPALLNALSGWRSDGEDEVGVPGVSPRISWVIVGGESGPQISGVRATPFGQSRALIMPCRGEILTNRPFHRGEDCNVCDGSGWMPKFDALDWVRSLRDQCRAASVPFFFKQWGGRTSKSAGRELDGRTWDEYPTAVPAAVGLQHVAGVDIADLARGSFLPRVEGIMRGRP